MAAMNTTMPVINQYTVTDCTDITPLCPVDQTIYGYYPNMGANAFFLALFAILCAVNVVQGIRYKTWTYMIALALGSLTEAIGMFLFPILVNSRTPFSNNSKQATSAESSCTTTLGHLLALRSRSAVSSSRLHSLPPEST